MSQDLGELQMLLDGQLALNTKVKPKLIKAKFAPELFACTGEYKLEIRQVSSGKTVLVGIFLIEPEKAEN